MVGLVPRLAEVGLQKIQVVLVQRRRGHAQRPEAFVIVQVSDHDLLQNLQVTNGSLTADNRLGLKVEHVVGVTRV